MNDHVADDVEDILNESLAFLGGQPVIDDNVVHYGALTLQIASKQGKANTLLADHLFSPALYFAERIERGLLPAAGSTVIELGAGTGLPSLLMATLPNHPSLVVVTDYPDETILGNLARNVENNAASFRSSIRCLGYEWGRDVDVLLKLLPSAPSENSRGYDIMILSDLLHFHGSHDALITSIKLLLLRAKESQVHVSAGKYTHQNVCDEFLVKAQHAGLIFEEVVAGPDDAEWKGSMTVSGLDIQALSLRKSNCSYWIGRWSRLVL